MKEPFKGKELFNRFIYLHQKIQMIKNLHQKSPTDLSKLKFNTLGKRRIKKVAVTTKTWEGGSVNF